MAYSIKDLPFPGRFPAKARQVADAGDYVLAPGGVGDFFFIVTAGNEVSLKISNSDGDDWVTKPIGALMGADEITYTPDDAGDWVGPPTELEGAADELASRLSVVEAALIGGSGGTLGGCRLKRTSDFTTLTSSYIQWQTEDYDTGTYWDISDPTSIVPGSTGRYLVLAQATIIVPDSTNGNINIGIYVDDVLQLYSTLSIREASGSPRQYSVSVNGVVQVTNSAHKIAINAGHGYGSTRTLKGDALNTFVSVEKLT